MRGLVFLVVVLATVDAQLGGNVDTVCRNVVNQLDCRGFDYKPICATDGKEYSTECEFAKAHCVSPTLKVSYEGPCGGATTTTGVPVVTTPAPVVTTAAATNAPVDTTAAVTSGPGVTTDAVTNAPVDTTPVVVTMAPTDAPVTGTTTNANLSPLCNNIVNSPCADDNTPLCANDGNTYDNYCQFNKGRCYQPDLVIAYAGQCSGTDTFPPLTTPSYTTKPPSVFDIICRTLSQVACTPGDTVCASNGQTYASACDFEKAKCSDDSIKIVSC